MEILNEILTFLFTSPNPNLILCDPVSIGLIALGVGAVGTGVQVVSAIKQGDAANDAAQYNAEMASNNAIASINQATEDERMFRVQSRQMLGDIRSGYAASGVTLEGSPEDVLYQSASNAELDALKIRHGGQLKAKGYKDSEGLSIMQGRSAQANGYMSAAGLLLKGTADGLGKIKF